MKRDGGYKRQERNKDADEEAREGLRWTWTWTPRTVHSQAATCSKSSDARLSLCLPGCLSARKTQVEVQMKQRSPSVALLCFASGHK